MILFDLIVWFTAGCGWRQEITDLFIF